MSIKGLKRFYDDSSCCHFVVYDSAPVLSDPDVGSGSLTYESPPSTYSDQPRRQKAKRGRFLDDSVVTGFRYKFGHPALKDRSVECMDRGWTPRYMVRLWKERIRESSHPKCVEERDFWFALVPDCGWDSFWSLNVDRVWYKKQALPEFPPYSLCRFLVGPGLFLLLLL